EPRHVCEDADEGAQQIFAAIRSQVSVGVVTRNRRRHAQHDLRRRAAHGSGAVDDDDVGRRGIGEAAWRHRNLAAIEVGIVLAGGGAAFALDEHLSALIREQQPDETSRQRGRLLDDANAIVGNTTHTKDVTRLYGPGTRRPALECPCAYSASSRRVYGSLTPQVRRRHRRSAWLCRRARTRA